MNKMILVFALGILTASAYATDVAICGDYTLSQESSSSYFAGILHTQNSYTLTDADGNAEDMEINLNSEGATLKSLYIPAGLSINAMWNQFELSIENEEKHEKIECQKL